MIRRFLQSALCICLSPLLVAQQAVDSSSTAPAQVNIDVSKDTRVQFLSPDMASLAAIRTGALVQFVIDTDLTAGDAVLIRAGVPIAGVVVQVKHASRVRHRDGQLIVRVTEMVSGRMTDVTLRCSNPADQYVGANSHARPVNKWKVVEIALLAAMVLGFYLGPSQWGD
jgi:hypothetical protein